MASQKLTVPITFDMDISYALTAGQTPSTYVMGTFSPLGANSASYTTFPVPSGLSFSVLNYKIISALSTDMYLSYILDGTVQSSVVKANYFNANLFKPSVLSSPITAGPTETLSLIAYPVSTVTTGATQSVTATCMLAPVQ